MKRRSEETQSVIIRAIELAGIAVIAVASGTTACGTSGSDGGQHGSAAGGSPTFWSDVQPLLADRCQMCHANPPLYGAPMALVRYEDLQAQAVSNHTLKVHQMVVKRIQPNSGQPPMPPVASNRLNASQIAMITAWSNAGAPEGTPPATPTGAGPAMKPETGGGTDSGGSSSASGTTANPPAGTGSSGGTPPGGGTTPGGGSTGKPDPEEPYTTINVTAPQAAIANGTMDLYGCFRTVVKLSAPMHAVEIDPVIDKAAVVHHVLLFRDNSKSYPASKMGFLCALDTVTNPSLELLHGWAPGGKPFVMPPEAGVRINDGDYLIAQIHYNNLTGPGVVDSSGMSFKATARLRPNDAAMLGVGTQSFSLPPGQSSVSRSGDCTLASPMHVFSYWPHMHLLGKNLAFGVMRGGSGSPAMLAQTEFSFEQQIAFPGNWDFAAGDVLTTTCTWDTTSRQSTTTFGEQTTEEMCYTFVAYYPPIGKVTCTN